MGFPQYILCIYQYEQNRYLVLTFNQLLLISQSSAMMLIHGISSVSKNKKHPHSTQLFYPVKEMEQADVLWVTIPNGMSISLGVCHLVMGDNHSGGTPSTLTVHHITSPTTPVWCGAAHKSTNLFVGQPAPHMAWNYWPRQQNDVSATISLPSLISMGSLLKGPSSTDTLRQQDGTDLPQVMSSFHSSVHFCLSSWGLWFILHRAKSTSFCGPRDHHFVLQQDYQLVPHQYSSLSLFHCSFFKGQMVAVILFLVPLPQFVYFLYLALQIVNV